MSSAETVSVSPASTAPRRQLHQLATIAVGALLTALVFLRHGLDADSFVLGFLMAVLVLISWHDIRRRVIPNRVVLPAWGIVLVANTTVHPARWWEWLLASFGAALLFLVLWRLSRGGLGMGDVKLVGLLGAALGGTLVPALIVGTTASAVVCAAIIGKYGAEGRKRTIPLGPFLAAGAAAAVLFL